jgi:regulator of replication initiation timing
METKSKPCDVFPALGRYYQRLFNAVGAGYKNSAAELRAASNAIREAINHIHEHLGLYQWPSVRDLYRLIRKLNRENAELNIENQDLYNELQELRAFRAWARRDIQSTNQYLREMKDKLEKIGIPRKGQHLSEMLDVYMQQNARINAHRPAFPMTVEEVRKLVLNMIEWNNTLKKNNGRQITVRYTSQPGADEDLKEALRRLS